MVDDDGIQLRKSYFVRVLPYASIILLVQGRCSFKIIFSLDASV
jgi:hypothetical protein